MRQRLRIFISSPGDVAAERLRTDLILDKLSQDYSRFFTIESYRWEHEAMLASQHFQDVIESPSKFDIVVLILWSRLGTPLPERTALREYRGIDDRVPVTGTEWEYEEALQAARERGAPDLLAFRKISSASIDPLDPAAQARSFAQLNALNVFWQRHFADGGVFLAAYDTFRTMDEFSHRLEESLSKLIERRIRSLAADTGIAADPIWLDDPFRGLHSYEFEHAPIFFGRNALITKATEQLAASATRSSIAFLLVSGASGSGKSSLVKAGVVPRLSKPQRITGMAFLRRVIFRPGTGGTDVFLALARALTNAEQEGVGLPELMAPGQDAAQLAAYLRGAVGQPGYLFANALGHVTDAARASGKLLSHEEAKLILVVDQLEEIFTTPGIQPEARRLFAALLDGLARSGVVWVIATLRADFWHRAIDIPELVELAEGIRRLDVSAPSSAELAEMIRKPAQAAGLSFEAHADSGLGLDVVVAADAANAPGVLPLLSFTLDELYSELKRHGSTVLTHASYEALGGLQGAIATRAETVLGEVAEAAQRALPGVLRALTTVPDSTDQMPVARPSRLEAFSQGTPARMLVDAFTSARLLVAADEGSVPTLRLAHEALLRRWDRARDQLALDRRDLETRARVERLLERWTRAEGRARRLLLLRDPDLANALALAKRWGEELDAALRAFIRRSARRARLRQTLTATAAISFAIVAVVAVMAAKKAREATKEAEVSLWLANSQTELRAGRIDPALGWAWRAFTEKQVGDTRSAVLAALMQISPNLVGRFSVGEAFPQALAWVDNETLAYSTSRGDLEFLDASRGAVADKQWMARRIAQPSGDDPSQAVVGLRPTGSDRLVAVLRGGTILSIIASDPTVRVIPPARQTEINAGPHAAAISADGNLIATAPTAQAPGLYRCGSIGSGASPICSDDPPPLSDFVRAVEISPNGDRIAMGTRDGRIDVFPVSAPASPGSMTPGFPVVSLAWHPSREWLAVGGEEGTIAVFETRNYSEMFRFSASKSLVSTLRWSPTGTELAFVCDGKLVCIAPFNHANVAQAPADFPRFQGHTNAVAWLAWSPNGALLATADAGHDIVVWSLMPDRQVAFDLRPSDGAAVTGIAFSPAARQLAGVRQDGDVSLWDSSVLSASSGRGPVDQTRKLRGGSRDGVFLTWRRDGALSVAYKDGTIAHWPLELNDPPRLARAPWEPFQIAFTGSNTLAAVSADRRLYLIDAERLDIGPTATMDAPHLALSARAVTSHPSDSLLPVSYDGGQISIWDLSTRQISYSLPIVDPIAPLALSVSPDGHRLAATGGDRFVKIFDLESRSIWRRLPLQAEETGGAVAFGPDGKLLAAIGADDRIYMWEMGRSSAEPFLSVDAGSSGQYAVGLAWLGATQLAVLRPDGAIRVITLNPLCWRNWLNSLHFPAAQIRVGVRK